MYDYTRIYLKMNLGQPLLGQMALETELGLTGLSEASELVSFRICVADV